MTYIMIGYFLIWHFVGHDGWGASFHQHLDLGFFHHYSTAPVKWCLFNSLKDSPCLQGFLIFSVNYNGLFEPCPPKKQSPAV